MALPAGIRAVVLDIEGTTTPIAFVYETLFPYARAELGRALERAAVDSRIAEAQRLLREEHELEARQHDGVPPFGNGAAFARYLMDRDRKSTGLKALQGMIWETGYREGALRSVVFEDVPAALASWKNAGIPVRIYSSGSVLAQRLLFAHTQFGDLTPFIDGWHDTTTGPKVEPASYREIARALGLPPRRVLFLSDARAELDAAGSAGLATGLVERPGNPPKDPGSHPVHPDFRLLHS